MRKGLSEVRFEDLMGKSFDLILIVEMLCEVCDKPLGKREKFLRRIQISGIEDHQNFLNRARIYDRVEVDVENARICLYSHDYPGDVHPECVEKL